MDRKRETTIVKDKKIGRNELVTIKKVVQSFKI